MTASRILIIEDDPALLRGLKDNFAAAGYDVRTAADGQRGLDALLAEPPDLVLLDLMLPRVSGYDICRTARERGLAMPIIMLTAKGQEEDIVRGLELGADDYVTKPFGIRELLARVKTALRRLGDTGAVRRFGDFRLDPAAHKLFRGDTEIELTGKEYKLLAEVAPESWTAGMVKSRTTNDPASCPRNVVHSVPSSKPRSGLRPSRASSRST